MELQISLILIIIFPKKVSLFTYFLIDISDSRSSVCPDYSHKEIIIFFLIINFYVFLFASTEFLNLLVSLSFQQNFQRRHMTIDNASLPKKKKKSKSASEEMDMRQ